MPEPFSDIGIAVLGGIISILLVAVWRWISDWALVQLRRAFNWLRRVYNWQIRMIPILRQIVIGAVGAIVAVLLWNGVEELRFRTYDLQNRLSKVEQVAGELRAMINEGRGQGIKLGDIVVESGTIMPEDWELYEHRSANGITSDVVVDLSRISQPKIFLSRRGDGVIWETQGLSAFPLGSQAMSERTRSDTEIWYDGFSVFIHEGALQHRDAEETILEFARSREWHVDWIVVGRRRAE